MQRMLTAVLVVGGVVALAGCPTEVPIPRVLEVSIAGTCGEAGADCEAGITTVPDKKAFDAFAVSADFSRPDPNAAAEGIVEVEFTSTDRIRGHSTNDTTEVLGDLERFLTLDPENANAQEVTYERELKTALDNDGQFQMTVAFLGAPPAKRSDWSRWLLAAP